MNMNDEKLQMMRNEKIPKVLLKLGMPTMIGMLVSALYNLLDTYFVGGLGTSQIAAVSIAFPIGQILVGLGLTFGSGASSYISRLFGEDNGEKANTTASTALYSSLFIGTIASVAVLCSLDNILIALGATETILPYARTYTTIYVIGCIINIFNVTINNILTSEGASKYTMVAMLVGGSIDAVLNPVFIYLLNMGIRGAAITTVLGEAITALFYMWYILRKKGLLNFSIHRFSFDRTIFFQIFKVGIPLFVFQLLTNTSIGLTNTMASAYGDSAVAAMGIVTRILTIGTFFVFGYTKGFQPVAGYNFGAKNYDRLIESVKVSLIWTTCFCSILAIAIIVFPEAIVSLFSKSDAMVISIGSQALRASGIMFFFFGFQMVYGSLFLALGKGKEGGILSISRQGLFFIPIILIFPYLFGLEGVIWAQPTADFLTVILTSIFAVKLGKTIKSLKCGNDGQPADNEQYENQ